MKGLFAEIEKILEAGNDVIAQQAKILVMDEPSASLDFGNRIRIMQTVRALIKDGCAVIQSTHDPDQAFLYSGEDYIFTDDSGREVKVPGKITRIVPSGPLAQIVLFALAPEMFVGLATKWNDSAEGIIAGEYFSLPYFGQLYGTADLNVEELALADPQIIIDIGEAKNSRKLPHDLNFCIKLTKHQWTARILLWTAFFGLNNGIKGFYPVNKLTSIIVQLMHKH